MSRSGATAKYLSKLHIESFRNIDEAHISFDPNGPTLISGINGQGKTNLVEAVAMIASLESFRGADSHQLVQTGMPRARIRAELVEVAWGIRGGGGGVSDSGAPRETRIDIEIYPGKPMKAFRDGNPVRPARDLLGEVRAVVFSPDDLELVKGSPSVRRRFLDQALSSISRSHDQVRLSLDRVLRQRSQLVKVAAGRLSAETEATLDVWDTKMAELGEHLVAAREFLVSLMAPHVERYYLELSGGRHSASVQYGRSWEGSLLDALRKNRDQELRTGHLRFGPQRDEIHLTVAGNPARAYASQGEQRSLALAMTLALRDVIAERTGSDPLLLLDDLFSELDAHRSNTLVRLLPASQSLITSASGIPEGLVANARLKVEAGRVAIVDR